MAPAIPSLLFCLLLLLLAPHHGRSSYHTSYTHGGRHFVLRSSDYTGPESPKPPTCSSIPSGRGNGPLPLVHRLSPCSPLGAARNQGKPSVDNVLHRDALRLHSLFGDDSSASARPAAVPSSGVTVPTTGTPLGSYPGAFEYLVVAGYGTPVQKFAVGFDAITKATLLRCKPCAAGEPCDQAFDPSQSSSFEQVQCGSPDCPLSACSGPSCTSDIIENGTLLFNATFATDTLTLSQSTTVENFRVACMEMGARITIDDLSGILDLSRDSHSLASRAPSSPDTVAFSYCLPSRTTTQGFLSIGATRPELSGRNASYATLRSNATRPNMYFVQLVGLGVGGLDLPIPPTTLAGDSLIELQDTTFTCLKPDVYAVLRDQFRKAMSRYRAARPSRSSRANGIDTCYDLTGLKSYSVPVITLKFDGGANLDLNIEQMLYFNDRENPFSVGCLAFAAAPKNAPTAEVIGTLAQVSTEVVYDVRGGKVGFVPHRC